MTAPQTRYPQAILVSCEIPWDENESLLDDVFRRSVQATLEHYNHLYIFGTAGEGYAVNHAQFRQIVDIFYDETRGQDIHPMVGLIGMSTATVLEKAAIRLRSRLPRFSDLFAVLGQIERRRGHDLLLRSLRRIP